MPGAKDLSEIVELDINPLLADEQGVLVLHSRMRVATSRAMGVDPFSIRPYPEELEEWIDWQSQRVLLRPIRRRRRHHGRLGHVHRRPRATPSTSQPLARSLERDLRRLRRRRNARREIIEGAPIVDIFGEPVRVRARIHTINGFSAHADQAELLAWHTATGQPKRTFLVHGDAERGMKGMAESLAKRGQPTMLPALH